MNETSDSLKEHAQKMAEDARRPFIYLQSAVTKAACGLSKEEWAKSIAERDNISQGLVCVFSVLETCSSFKTKGNTKTKKLEIVPARRKCLHYYFYFMDPEFGFMHVRLQSWFPFQIQIYINGREWLGRQLDKFNAGYQRHDNSFLQIDDLRKARGLCDKFAHRQWFRVLNNFARQVNPILKTIRGAGLSGYYWCADQMEYATDIMFKDRACLEKILPDLMEHAYLNLSSEDVLRFLGRKPHANFKGETTTDLKKRPEGWRVKHRVRRNSIKMYDKMSVLRIETTINNPREFKVLRVVETPEGLKRRWQPMGKGVANIWRYSQIAERSNARYLDSLPAQMPKSEAIEKLDDLCRSRKKNGAQYPKLVPFMKDVRALFHAALSGENTINGFRNKDIRSRLYENEAKDSTEEKRRCGRVSRLIKKLRGHSLVRKVKNSHLYRVTGLGSQVMASALNACEKDFPMAMAAYSNGV